MKLSGVSESENNPSTDGRHCGQIKPAARREDHNVNQKN